MKHYHPYILLALLSYGFNAVNAQNLDLTFTEFKDDKLVVHYSLKDTVPGRFYTVRLYSSGDNFLNPLERISGDAGLEVKPGPDNKIVWDMRADLGASFEGKVALEIRGRVFVPFISTESINQYRVFKRDRKYNLTWTGGSPQNILNFDLYKGDSKVASYPNVGNAGHHSFSFSNSVRPGRGYRFRISDSKNKEDVVYTKDFRIKRRFPLLYKIAGTAVIGALLVVILEPTRVVDDDPDLPAGPNGPK